MSRTAPVIPQAKVGLQEDFDMRRGARSGFEPVMEVLQWAGDA